jgi:hypothetical protein
MKSNGNDPDILHQCQEKNPNTFIFNCVGYENIKNIKNSRKFLLKETITAFHNRQKN